MHFSNRAVQFVTWENLRTCPPASTISALMHSALLTFFHWERELGIHKNVDHNLTCTLITIEKHDLDSTLRFSEIMEIGLEIVQKSQKRFAPKFLSVVVLPAINAHHTPWHPQAHAVRTTIPIIITVSGDVIFCGQNLD